MVDLNMMMREQARTTLQTQLDAAVTNGETETARKIAADMEKLAVQTAPKAPPFGQVEITAALEKTPWFGIDPKKSAKVVEFGKTMDPKKFATADLFAAALIKAVDDEFKPAGASAEGEDGEGEGEDGEGEDEGTEPATPPKKPVRRTDAPGEGDTLGRGAANRRTAGPWKKLSDAPGDIQKEVNRAADKLAPKTKEGREGFIEKALGAHYAAHQRTKGKK